jgi:hypothetical protein
LRNPSPLALFFRASDLGLTLPIGYQRSGPPKKDSSLVSCGGGVGGANEGAAIGGATGAGAGAGGGGNGAFFIAGFAFATGAFLAIRWGADFTDFFFFLAPDFFLGAAFALGAFFFLTPGFFARALAFEIFGLLDFFFLAIQLPR